MQTKQKIIIIIASVIAVVAIAVSTLFILKNNADTNINKEPVTQQTADELKTKAIRALKDNNTKAAKKLFEQARDQYIELDNINGKIDMDAQIFLIENPGKE